MKTKKRIWIITAILALITTGMVYFYLGQVKAASQENKAEMSEVVVAISTVPAHVKVTEEMLEIKKIPTEAVHADTYTSYRGCGRRHNHDSVDCRGTSID